MSDIIWMIVAVAVFGILLHWRFRTSSRNGMPSLACIIVCNVYWDDWKRTNLSGPEVGKAVVMFDPNVPLDLDAIESMEVVGPGVNERFAIQKFNLQNMNGYMPGPMAGKWFQVYIGNEFLTDGEYTITVRFKNGRVQKADRMLKYSGELLEQYHRSGLCQQPSGPVSVETAQKLELKWNRLDSDAYYVTRLWEKHGVMKKKASNGYKAFDNAGSMGKLDRSGSLLNKVSVSIPYPLDSEYEYVWFTEILDTDQLANVNVAILGPFMDISFYDQVVKGESADE